jgi:hypothetical protein
MLTAECPNISETILAVPAGPMQFQASFLSFSRSFASLCEETSRYLMLHDAARQSHNR